jgi:hypothetical protein
VLMGMGDARGGCGAARLALQWSLWQAALSAVQ